MENYETNISEELIELIRQEMRPASKQFVLQIARLLAALNVHEPDDNLNKLIVSVALSDIPQIMNEIIDELEEES